MADLEIPPGVTGVHGLELTADAAEAREVAV
jgi:hypothetical protein